MVRVSEQFWSTIAQGTDRNHQLDRRIGTIAQLILFSTESGDAWLLDVTDQLAACARLARDGDPDFLIPLNERHLRRIVEEWGLYYNRGRPHSSLGPGIPKPSQEAVPASDHRHKPPAGYRVGKTPVPGGLHHEYRLVGEAA